MSVGERDRKLYEEGESLARSAVAYNIPRTELRTIFETSQRKSTPYFEAYIRMQTSRKMRPEFGAKLLYTLENHRNNKQDLIQVLRYMIMLFGYVEKLMLRHDHLAGGMTVSFEIEQKIRKTVESSVGALGFSNVKLRRQGKEMYVDVTVKKPTNLVELKNRIRSNLVNGVPELKGLLIKVWTRTSGSE